MIEEDDKSVINRLRKDLPITGAKIAFFQYGGGADESKIVGTKEGFQRMGIELLSFGLSGREEIKNGSSYPDIDSITDHTSDYRFDWFEIKDEESFHKEDEKNGSILPQLAGIVAFIWFVIFPFLGVYGLYRWVSG